MNAKRFAVAAFLIGALASAFETPRQVRAQGNKTPYPQMARREEYLMDRDAEVALARSAAPESVSRDAKVLVLGAHGYETAAEGENGFVCVVERAWMSPFDTPEFWNPKIRAPLCFNPQAVRSILPITYKRTEVALTGQSKAQILQWTKDAYAKKTLPALEPGAMCYMMSKKAYLTDDDDHNLSHLMFYTPLIDGADWGANLPNSPVILGEKGPPEPFTEFIVPVGRWSDGTPAPVI